MFCSFVSSCAQHAANGYAARLIADCPTWRLPAAQCCTLRRARGTRACHAVRSSGTSRKMVSVQQSQHHRLMLVYPCVRVCACWWRLAGGASSRARPLAPAVCQASSAPGRRGGTEWRCIVPPLRLWLLIWSCSSPEHQIIFRIQAVHVYTRHTGCQCLPPSCPSRSSRGKAYGFATQTALFAHCFFLLCSLISRHASTVAVCVSGGCAAALPAGVARCKRKSSSCRCATAATKVDVVTSCDSVLYRVLVYSSTVVLDRALFILVLESPLLEYTGTMRRLLFIVLA